MHQRYIDIADRWAIVFCYDITLFDTDDIASMLEALGCDERKIRRATSVILGTNKGFTYSNDEARMSLVCISHASSIEQWWDSVVHEIDHVQDAICWHYDVPLGSESAAYLQGYIMRKIIQAIR